MANTGNGSKLTSTAWVLRSDGSDVCHRGCAYNIQCFKPFKCMECAILSMVFCTIKNISIRVLYSPNFGLTSVAI